MLLAAGVEPPRMVFGHGFVYKKNEATGAVERESKTLGNVTEPMDLITRFNAEAFRYYFLRECPFPSDGEYSLSRFAALYNADLANNLGNLYSRVITLITKNYDGVLPGGPINANVVFPIINSAGGLWGNEIVLSGNDEEILEHVREIQRRIGACRYSQALQAIWETFLTPSN